MLRSSVSNIISLHFHTSIYKRIVLICVWNTLTLILTFSLFHIYIDIFVWVYKNVWVDVHLYVFVVVCMVYEAYGALLLFLLPRLLINFNFRPKSFTSCHLSLGFGQLQHPLQSISSVSFLPYLFVLPNLSLILFLFPLSTIFLVT